MAKAFLLCDVKKFQHNNFSAPVQQSLIEYEGEPEITIDIDKMDYHIGYHLYKCHHDFKVKVFGKTYGQTFNYYFVPANFNLFYNPNCSLAIVSAKSNFSLDFIEKLNQYDGFELVPVVVDFEKIVPRIIEMTGVWVSGMKQANLKTAGYFGPHVNKSKEYKAAVSEGQVSTIQMPFVSPTTGNEHTILLSSKGTVTLYDNFKTIEEELEFINHIYFQLIK